MKLSVQRTWPLSRAAILRLPGICTRLGPRHSIAFHRLDNVHETRTLPCRNRKLPHLAAQQEQTDNDRVRKCVWQLFIGHRMQSRHHGKEEVPKANDVRPDVDDLIVRYYSLSNSRKTYKRKA